MEPNTNKNYEKIPQHVEDAARYAVDAAYHVQRKMGQGLPERSYEKFMEYELRKRGCNVKRQVKFPITYDGIVFNDEYFIVDILVDDCLILELKAVENIITLHKYQLLTYLKHTGIRLGLLINFNSANMREGISRIIN